MTGPTAPAGAPADETHWDIKNARTVYDNPWLRLREYQVTAPTGAAATYGLVQFKKAAVGVLPLEPDGSTYLVGQARFATGNYSWELPEGGVEPGSDPVATAHRELAEEAGLGARVLQQVLFFHTSNSVCDERAYGYVATELYPNPVFERDAVELLAVRRLHMQELLAEIDRGLITDSLTIMLALKVFHLAATGAIASALAEAILQRR